MVSGSRQAQAVCCGLLFQPDEIIAVQLRENVHSATQQLDSFVRLEAEGVPVVSQISASALELLLELIALTASHGGDHWLDCSLASLTSFVYRASTATCRAFIAARGKLLLQVLWLLLRKSVEQHREQDQQEGLRGLQGEKGTVWIAVPEIIFHLTRDKEAPGGTCNQEAPTGALE